MDANQLARLTGAIYFVQMFAGSFPLYVRSRLVTADNVDQTVADILQAESLFRYSMLSEVAVSLTWLGIAYVLYLLLSRVQRESSILFLLLAAVGVAAINANVAHLSSSFLLLTGQAYAGTFPLDQQQSLGIAMFAVFKRGEISWSLFAGLWLLPLGYAILRSHFLPGVFGVLLMMASLGYVLASLSSYVSPTFSADARQLIIFSGLIEIAFGFWLLIRGVNDPAAGAGQSADS